MFIETYYDERSGLPAGSGEKGIPYPELVGEELSLWQKYLPVRTELENVPFWLHDNMPLLVSEQLEKARSMSATFLSHAGRREAHAWAGKKKTAGGKMVVQAAPSGNGLDFLRWDIGSDCVRRPLS